MSGWVWFGLFWGAVGFFIGMLTMALAAMAARHDADR